MGEPFTNRDRAREYVEMSKEMRDMGNAELADQCLAMAFQLIRIPDPRDVIAAMVMEAMKHV